MAGGYDCKWVKDPPDELKCLICLSVAREPQQDTECGKVFCLSCITEYQKTKNTCPNCRGQLTIFKDARSARHIKALKVKCDGFDNSCKWVGELGSLGGHIATCDHILVPCQNECKNGNETMKVLRKNLRDHLTNKCPRRRHLCQHCKEKGEYKERTTTHLEICPKVKVPCPNKRCKISLFRCEVDTHRSTCDYETVSCKYAEVGCEEKCLRKDLKKHEEDNQLHLRVTTERVLQLTKETTDMKNETTALKMETAALKMETTALKMETTALNRETTALKKETTALKRETTALKRETTDLKMETTDLKNETTALKRETTALKMETTTLKRETTALKMETADLKRETTNLTKGTAFLNKVTTDLKMETIALKKVKTDMALKSSTSPCTFRLTKYKQHKNNNKVIYSDPFYTSHNGYKMYIRVYANGVGAAKDTHVSVYAYLMKGDNDDSLTWPFTGSIRVELLNQLEDKNHHKNITTFPADSEASKRVLGFERGDGYGTPKFIPHTDLDHKPDKNCQYLKDDTLIFRVSVQVPDYKPWLECTL